MGLFLINLVEEEELMFARPRQVNLASLSGCRPAGGGFWGNGGLVTEMDGELLTVDDFCCKLSSASRNNEVRRAAI